LAPLLLLPGERTFAGQESPMIRVLIAVTAIGLMSLTAFA
jgi:hypothetical protein